MFRVSLPASASDNERHPRSSPVASRGSHALLLRLGRRGVTIRCAAIVWVFTTPDSDIHPYASSSTTPMYVSRSRPSPPYSSGIVIPKSPSSFICSTIALRVRVGVLELGRDGCDLARDEPADGRDQLLADFGSVAVAVISRTCGHDRQRYRSRRGGRRRRGPERGDGAGTVRRLMMNHQTIRASGATRRSGSARSTASCMRRVFTYIRPYTRTADRASWSS